jgi:hypothetical protein
MGSEHEYSCVPVTVLSAALDEIWRLRMQLAVEARTLEANLALRTFPRGRREITGKQVERMRRAARGEVIWPSALTDAVGLAFALDCAAISKSLTRTQWEEQAFRVPAG